MALSYQFFNKTRQNVLATRRAAALVIDPESFARYRLALEYVRVETGGPLFERMKAHLAGIASHTGMAGVFKLQGADVYRVLAVEQVPGHSLPGTAPQRHHLAARARDRAAHRGMRRPVESRSTKRWRHSTTRSASATR